MDCARGEETMNKTVIMSTAIVAAVLCGQPLMAAVFGSIMVTGLLTGHLVSDSVRRLIECPTEAFKPAVSRSRYPRQG
jgi:hypothetical protein